MSARLPIRSDMFCVFSEPRTFSSFKETPCRLASISPKIPTSSTVRRTGSGAQRLPVVLFTCVSQNR
jgi:hypothetical protein